VKTEDLDFYPFGKDEPGTPIPAQRPTSKDRAKAGPKSLGHDEAAIAECDNRKPLGRR